MTREIRWITSPYFVSDDVLMLTLHAADLCRIDVRIILPDEAGSRFVELASFAYFTSLINFGVRLICYCDQSMRQKLILVDGVLTEITTINIGQSPLLF